MRRRGTYETPEAPTDTRSQAVERERTTTDREFAGLATWLTGIIVALTGLLTAGGAYTGGVGRILRNHPTMLYWSITCVFVAVVLALVALGITHNSQIWKLHGRSIRVLRSALLALSVGFFFVAISLAMTATASSADQADRPTLSAQLIANTNGGWSIHGDAAASGVKDENRMQVLVYGVLAHNEMPERIFFSTTGPDTDGVVSESFEVPLPYQEFKAIVVTANHGDLPRACGSNRAFYAESNTVELQPAPLENVVEGRQAACLTLAPPPAFPPS